MKKTYILLILMMLFASMIPVQADPGDPEKIKIVYVYSGGVKIFNDAALDPIVQKYAEASGYVGHSTTVSEIPTWNFDDADVIILEHLDLSVVTALHDTLTTATGNGATIISATGNTDNYKTTDLTESELTEINKYIKNPSETNFKNLILLLAKFKGATVSETIETPIETVHYGIYHPDSTEVFKNAVEYMEWYKNRADGHTYDPTKPTIGVIPSSIMNNVSRDSPVWNYFVQEIEGRGYNVIVGTFVHNATKDLGETANIDNFRIDGEIIIDSAIAISRGGRLFSNAADLGVYEISQLNVPVLHAVQLYDKTQTEAGWKASGYGVIPEEHYQLAFGEQDGLIEPIVVAIKGDDGTTNTPIPSQADWMVDRAIGWADLSLKENSSKKIVIPYYAAEAGKANIGADPDYYLNAPESILNLLNALKNEGYDVGELPATSEELIKLMIANGHNIGTWAPGELEKFVENGNAKLLPIEEYVDYFNTLPAEKRAEITDNIWGEPPGDIMIYESGGQKYFVIPSIEFGNVMLTPHPLRGRDQSTDALTHIGSYPPTHQTLAAYYYFTDVFEADALLPVWSNLGVMPGKEATLAADDWTALMIKDVPHIHMLPMDATGMTDKRRANMLIVNFLTPYMLPSGLYGDLAELETQLVNYELYGDLETKEVTLRIIQELCENTGIDTALALNWNNPDADIKAVEKHLRSLKGSYIPYGDHVLGVPPTSEQVFDMTYNMLSYNEFYTQTNGAEITIQLDDLLEDEDALNWESNKRALLTELFDSKTPKESIATVLGGEDSHIEYALTMALIYKLGLENEKPTNEQAFAIANVLLSQDITIQISSTVSQTFNFDTELYGADDTTAPAKKSELIQKVILDGEAAKPYIITAFGNDMYTTENSVTKQSKGADIEYLLKIVKIQIDELNRPTNEIDGLLNALDGQYIPTGQTGDPLQNFEAIPTGRNPMQDDSRLVPTKAAYEIGGKLANGLIETYQEKHNGAYPEKVAFLLWAVEAARTGGTNEGEIFQLLGVEPLWQGNGRLPNTNAFKAISPEDLGRPRIDVMVETSGSYRDTYSRQVIWINQAVKFAAEQPDSEEYPNYVKRNSDAIYEALKEEYGDIYSDADLREMSYARVFGPPVGEYTPGIENLAGSGLEDEIDAAELYIQRMSHVYGLVINGKTIWGDQMPNLLEKNLKDVDAGVFSRSSNLLGILDHPMVAAYFGGLASAIQKSGGNPEMYINNLRNGGTDVQSLSEFLNADLNSRYYNPTWIEGMMNSGYSGTTHMEEFFGVMGLWEMTTPGLVTENMWSQMYNTYMTENVNPELTNYLKNTNPYAYQSMTGTLLNSIYNGNWLVSKEIQQQLEMEYITQTNLNGVVCCHHTCSNMKFNANIVNGLISLDLPESEKQKYLDTVETALGKSIETIGPNSNSGSSSKGVGAAIVSDENSTGVIPTNSNGTTTNGTGFGQDSTPAGTAPQQVSGYEMTTTRMDSLAESIKDLIANPTSTSSTNIIAIVIVVLIVGAVFFGSRRKGL